MQAELEEAGRLAGAKTTAAQAQAAAIQTQNEQLLQAVAEAKQQLDAASATIEALTQQAAAQAEATGRQHAQVSRPGAGRNDAGSVHKLCLAFCQLLAAVRARWNKFWCKL